MLLWLLNLDFSGGGVQSRYTGPRPSDICRLRRKRKMLLAMEARRLESLKIEEDKKQKAALALIALRKAEEAERDHQKQMAFMVEVAALEAKLSALEGSIARLKITTEKVEVIAERTEKEIRIYSDEEAISALILCGAI